jgi:hypothetical protein
MDNPAPERICRANGNVWYVREDIHLEALAEIRNLKSLLEMEREKKEKSAMKPIKKGQTNRVGRGTMTTSDGDSEGFFGQAVPQNAASQDRCNTGKKKKKGGK